ncbi:heat shock protein transcriptional repressor HspR [Microbacterium azadirachtae]|uniref:Putative heat shock protein HspR n=1 Tax=Microbacterium azadirachtae TaxID=582680 RepID=A0A0F0LMV2_9MICO|nr:MerR family transcriptional regulator [Microbacterium azadirachtae]KJL33600.1 putative heat shock protein HspR [Microbacterium azadirachtae]UXW85712.1 MerR family transcriptional regulator [Microbacterium azadirachtae]SDL74825.1 MerR family transcriptional regulator, heat shock protein HspR [Microbacterium azadirachtae]SEG04031.1 MerR family transcriptional regulator, heat shock protein HspR [Microbacterium azadirachtae]SEG06799.1 MerR family transcriptional regulator, heat shock protein Hs
MSADTPIFAIAVAAELAGMHPQTLRQYDRIGLVVPGRTRGGSRRYSQRDIAQLREVAQLSSEGMSLPAIAKLLDLEDEVRTLRRRVVELEHDLREERASRPGVRVFAAGATGSIMAVPSGRRIRRSTEIVLWRPWLNRPEASDDELADDPDDSER